ncbi:MAG: aminotransferase class I/II-fold pyridoxal phosphate-dependent enzyme [Candidatus Thorarchaeota archaeon]|nr:MAG: aminotransferase class I/II-fold pyridoxal phosphate-dependent enzyme [Candidatus Thorarchaeota archaeon]
MKLSITKRASNLTYAIRDIVVAAKRYEKTKEETPLYLNIGDPIKYDWKTPGFMVTAIAQAAEEGANGYAPSEGIDELRRAATEKEKRVNSIDLDPERVLVTSGVSEAIEFLAGALVKDGSEFLVPGPSYPPYISYIGFFGGRPVQYRTIEEEDWIPDIDDLRRRINEKTVGIVVINPNNPTGAVYDEKTLKEIASIAGEHKLPLITDEIYDQLTFDKVQTPMVKAAGEIPVVGFNGVSKVYLAPGWRVGYVYFHDENGELEPLRDAMVRQARIRICANSVAQVASIAALRSDGSYLGEMMRKLRERRDLIAKRLNDIDSISTTIPQAAFYIMPKVDLRNRWTNDTEFVLDVLDSTGVVFVPGSGFSPEFGKDHFRSVFLPPPDMIDQAMNRLEDFMSRK